MRIGYLGSTLPPPDPNADPNAFDIKDPRMRALMGLPSLGNLLPGQTWGQDGKPMTQGLNGLNTLSQSPGLLGSGVGSSQSPNVLGLATAPPPTLPDFTGPLTDMGAAAHNAAVNKVNPFDVDAASARAKSLGDTAALKTLVPFDPNNPAFHFSAVTPLSLGAPTPVDVPTRPAVRQDPMAMLLGAVGGAFDPRGAGAINAAPIMAGVHVSQQQYDDNERAFNQMHMQEMDQYEAQKANAENSNQFSLMNALQQRGANILGLNAQNADAARRAPYVQGGTAADALAAPMTGFAQQDRTAAGAGADAETLRFNISTLEKEAAEKINLYRATNSAQVRGEIAAIQAEMALYRTQLQVQERGAYHNGKLNVDQQNADSRQQRADAYDRRIDDNGRLIK